MPNREEAHNLTRLATRASRVHFFRPGMNELGGENYIRRLGLNSTGEFQLIAVKPGDYTPTVVFRNVNNL